jgi:hypothetical protein
MSNNQSKALVVAIAPRKPDADLDAIFATARVIGNASQALLALFRKAKTEARRDASIREFVLGRMCGSLNIERPAAEALITLKPWDKKKAGSDRRNKTQQDALQAARALASSVGRTAGFPSKRNGKARAPRPTVAPQTTPESIHIKRFASATEFHGFVSLLADRLGKARTMNEQHLKLGDLGTLCRDFEAAVKAYKVA